MKADHPLMKMQRKAEAAGTTALRKWKIRAHAALHEAAHAVIACDKGHVVLSVCISVRRGSGMRHTPKDVSAARNRDEGPIALAGVALERIMHTGQDILCILPHCGSDLRCARGVYLDAHFMRPAYHTVKNRLLELWPVVEYAAVCILRRTAGSCTYFHHPRWNDTLWRCIWGDDYSSTYPSYASVAPPKLRDAARSKGQRYLKTKAHWASKNPPIEFLSALIQ